jgi:hypothetical protein
MEISRPIVGFDCFFFSENISVQGKIELCYCSGVSFEFGIYLELVYCKETSTSFNISLTFIYFSNYIFISTDFYI